MDLLAVSVLAALAWISLLAVVLALCKAASRADADSERLNRP